MDDTSNESIERVHVDALDKILGTRFRVLDDGFIRAVDYMGGDAAIVQAARVSYGKGTKQVHEDRGLIRYLMRHRHTTPFEMCEIKIHVRVPMDCWRQWIRHRTANVNEYSTRYSEAIDACQRTSPLEWRCQGGGNRQGSEGFLNAEVGEVLAREEQEVQKLCRDAYERRLQAGVAREQARKDLPLSTYTEAYWKIDLHNLLHFLSLRMDPHAQLEIRSYANIIGHEIVSRWCPMTWEAFLDYRVNATNFTRQESEILSCLVRGQVEDATKLAIVFGFLSAEGAPSQRNREREELEAKLKKLSVLVPWLGCRDG